MTKRVRHTSEIFKLSALLVIIMTVFAANIFSTSLAIFNKIDNTPIKRATVIITEGSDKSEKTHKTDDDGVFVFQSSNSRKVYASISHVGYYDLDTTIDLSNSEEEIKIYLRPLAHDLGSIVITGTRSPHILKDVPVQTELVTRKQILRTNAVTVDEALESSVGINIENTLSGKSLSMRGISGEQVLVLINGERVVGRVAGAIDLRQFSLANVKQIEIIKGTGSTLYGSDAMGGVINIIEETPSGNYSKSAASFDFGSYSRYKQSFKYDFGKKSISGSLNLSYLKSSSFDVDESTLQTNGDEDIKRINIGTSFKKTLSPNSFFKLNLRGMREDLGWIEELFRPGISPFVRDVSESNRRYDASIGYSYISGEKYMYEIKAFGSFYDHNFEKLDREFNLIVSNSNTEDMYSQLSFSGRYNKNKNVLVFGAEASYQDFRSEDNDLLSKPAKVVASYIQYEYNISDKLVFLPGVRYERHNTFGGHTNPSLNIRYKASESINIRLFSGFGFRAPSIKQQYYIFDHLAQGYKVIGGEVALRDYPNLNLNKLSEETSINSSLSFEYASSSFGKHRVTYFYNDLKDLIDFNFIGSDPLNGYTEGIFAYQNIENALTQGLEFESRFNLSRNYQLSFSYDYLDARNLANGNALPNRSRNRIKIIIDADLKKINTVVTVWGEYQSSQLIEDVVTTVEEKKIRPSRKRLNMNVSKKLSKKLNAFVKMENIIGQTNQEFSFYDRFKIFVGMNYY